jgi:hypothetical protein
MEVFSDNELEFIRRQIIKKYIQQANVANDVIREVPECPKSVGDEKFNFLSDYVEKELQKLYDSSSPKIKELEDFGRSGHYYHYSFSATLKKLFCEQHYKRPASLRRQEHFQLKSINRFYFYFSGKKRNEYFRERGYDTLQKELEEIQSQIDNYQSSNETIEELPTLTPVEENHSSSSGSSVFNSGQPFTFKLWQILIFAAILLALLIYYLNLHSQINDFNATLSSFHGKVIRDATPAGDIAGLMGTWLSYNRTPETNIDNKHTGKIFRAIQWKIDSNANGNLVFTRPTEVNENDGWVELINMQVNFFMNVHPKLADKEKKQNLGFRHFICKSNKVNLKDADTLWCLCTSFVHKDGRLEDPLASREILIREKPGVKYKLGLMPIDSIPKSISNWFPAGKSYLGLNP